MACGGEPAGMGDRETGHVLPAAALQFTVALRHGGEITCVS
jgi:hypothetical protein